MELLEIFQILGIEETKDEKAIKNAYRSKLAVTNPEDNPEGFKRLRTAYENACLYAKQSEDVEQEEEDVTPSGLWVAKVAAAYNNMDSRRNIESWKKLLADDVFLSLEEEENCRFKLLRFLMDHYRLPSNVWKLLDEKMNLVADAAILRERFPVDFISYVVSRCERGEDVEFDQFEGEADAAYDLFLQYYDRCWHALQEEELKQAEEFIRNADDLKIFHPVMEVCRAELVEKQGRIKDAIEMLLKLRERFPEDDMVCYNTAEILWRHERKKEAAEIYEVLKDVNKKHYMGNVRLTEWYYTCGQYKEAKECAEEVLSMGADDDFMKLLGKVNRELEKEMEANFTKGDWRTGLDLCWCYLQDGRCCEGISLAYSLEKKIPEEKRSEYNGLLTKLYIEAAEFEKSIHMAEVWEKSLNEKIEKDETPEENEKDYDRIRQSHLIRMQCYHSMGYTDKKYFEKAISEIEGMETGSSKDIGLMLEKAQIYMELEEYEKGLQMTERLVDEYQVYAAFATAQEIYRRMWDAQGVVQSGQACIQYFPNYIRAYEHIARVYLDLKYTDDLKAILKQAKENGVESPLLEAYEYQMNHEIPQEVDWDKRIKEFREEYLSKVENGELQHYEKGLSVLTEYLYTYPGTFLLVERGIFHKAANHLSKAKEDFEKALAENPAHPYALNSLSFVYKYLGEYDKALVCIKKAILYLGEDASPTMYSDMAELYMLLGENETAAEVFRHFLRLTGEAGQKSQYHMSNYAECLTKCKLAADAIPILDKAYPNRLEYYDEVLAIYQQAGMQKEARKALDEWYRLLVKNNRKLDKSAYEKYYSREAWQELLFGDGKRALEFFDKLIESKGVKKWERGGSGPLCDAIFASILCGDRQRGERFSGHLRSWQEREKAQGRNDYYEREKARLQLDYLADYYISSLEVLEEKLALEEACQICHFCTQCVCKELEGVRILHMLRKGEIAEAFERLESNLKKMPTDEYMIAIKNICRDGVKVHPYTVDGHRFYQENEMTKAVEEKIAEVKLPAVVKDIDDMYSEDTLAKVSGEKRAMQESTLDKRAGEELVTDAQKIKRQSGTEDNIEEGIKAGAKDNTNEKGLLDRIIGIFQKRK